MLRKVVIGAAGVLAALTIVIATRPSTFHVERSVTIAASPDSAFAQVNDFRAWRTWSPYEKLDPGMKRTYEGPSSGSGAIYAWAGNHEIGEGRMTIEKSVAPSLISIKLEFLKPFTATNRATFTFVPAGDGTKVTWSMDGRNNFVAKAFHLVVDMEKIVGKDFERGLLAMKTAAESAPQASVQATNSTR
jgi:hypothetical protein